MSPEQDLDARLAAQRRDPLGAGSLRDETMNVEAAIERLRDHWDHITNMQRGLTASQRLYIAAEYPEQACPDEITEAISEFEMLHELIPTILAAFPKRTA